MIPLGDTKQYRFLEGKGKFGHSFKKSPILPITDDNRKTLESFEKGQILTIKAELAGTESEYKITDISLYVSEAYPDGLLAISVERCSRNMTIQPTGQYRKENPSWDGLALNDIIAVQPMNQPSGQVFYMDFVYGKKDSKDVKLVDKPNKNNEVFPKELLAKALQDWNDSKLPSRYKSKL